MISIIDDRDQARKEKNSALKKVFDASAEETITDDQINSILAPVLAGIEEGKYGRSKGRRLKAWLAGPLPAIAAVAVLAISIAINSNGEPRQGETTDIFDAEVPMAQSVEAAVTETENEISGRAYFIEPANGGVPGETAAGSSITTEGASGVIIHLIRADSGEEYLRGVTEGDGTFKLSGFPDGVYRLRAELPPEGGLAFAAEVLPDRNSRGDLTTVILMIDGVIDHTFDMDGENRLGGVGIPICRTGN